MATGLAAAHARAAPEPATAAAPPPPAAAAAIPIEIAVTISPTSTSKQQEPLGGLLATIIINRYEPQRNGPRLGGRGRAQDALAHSAANLFELEPAAATNSPLQEASSWPLIGLACLNAQLASPR